MSSRPQRAGRTSAARGAGARREPAARAPRGGGLAAHAERLRSLVEPVVESAGYDLEDMDVSRAGRRSVLRVVVDSDTGVNLDAVAELSRAISGALDGAESDGAFGAEAYTLEVTSPGVDRPLREPRHWRRNVGRLVSVSVAEQTVVGRITAADIPVEAGELGVEMDVAGVPRRIRYAELGPGRVQIEFGRPTGAGPDGSAMDGSESGVSEAEEEA